MANLLILLALRINQLRREFQNCLGNFQ